MLLELKDGIADYLNARDKLTLHNLRLVFTIAGRYRGKHVPHNDLVQEGIIGLIRAADRGHVEIIEVAPERIKVTRQQYKRNSHAELDTAWAVVEVERPAVAWYDPKVHLRSGKRRIELGRFLTGEEKHELAEQLTRAIKIHSAL